MSSTSVKVAFALFMVLTAPAASFARGGHGGGHAGSAAMGHLGGSRPNAATIGAEEMLVDPSGIGNASRVAPLAPPSITAPVVPKFK
jgi:hypothetical protein